MKERPILFNAEMIKAILEGRKTMTRRILKPNRWALEYWGEAEQLIKNGTHYAQFEYKTTTHKQAERGNLGAVRSEQITAGTTAQLIAMANDTLLHCDYQSPPVDCPFGQKGDRLWVKESWSTHACFDDIESKHLETESIHYWADGNIKTGRKRPASQMPRSASRILLKITSIRVERLNDISESDCLKEGVGSPILRDCKKPKFVQLWEKINGADSWAKNPWVWVVEFKVIEGGAS